MKKQIQAPSEAISPALVKSIQTVANRLRKHSLTSTTEAGSGHPSSCCSCAELISTLFFRFLRYEVDNPGNPLNDRFVLSKGHAAPILWAAWAEAGAFPVEKLLTLRKIDSDLEGHPTPRNAWTQVATGSLGQGLSVGVGMALGARINQTGNRIFVLMGDGETAEGSVWEAAALAAHSNLDNLITLVDVNRLGQSQATMYGHDVESYRQRFASFGVAHPGHRWPQCGGNPRRPGICNRFSRPAVCHHRPHPQGKGRLLHGGQGRLARRARSCR